MKESIPNKQSKDKEKRLGRNISRERKISSIKFINLKK